MPAFPEPRLVALPEWQGVDGETVPGITLSVHDAGSGPAVVLCHGFPELAYSWRHQFGPLVEAGFRVIAPDQRGYGGSDRPEAVEAYDMHHLTGDLVGLLDALEIQRAVFVGHDWGGFVVWAMPALHPERTAGVVGVNTPYTVRPPMPPTKMMRALVPDPEKLYILWFQEPGVAEGVLDADPRMVFQKLTRCGVAPEQLAAHIQESGEVDMNPFPRLAELEPPGEPLLSEQELEHFVSAFERTGFGGGIQWYRNFDRNWETAPTVGSTKVEVPCLMVTAAWDPVLRPEMAAGMPALIPDLEMQEIPECGHWTQQEKPEALNRILVDWLQRRFGRGAEESGR